MTAAEELDAALGREQAFDIVVPSHFQLSRLIHNGQLAPLDTGRLSHYASVDVGLLAMLAGIDSANRYAVPYLWGSVGLVVNPKLAEASYGGPLPNSWGLLFDERLDAWAKDAKFILGRELRHTIERVSPEAVKPEEPAAG